MQSGYASVIDPLHPAAQSLCRQRGLLADRQVAGPGGYHGHQTRQLLFLRVGGGQTGGVTVAVGEFPPQLRFLLRREPGNQDIGRAPVHHAPDDSFNLRRRLPLAENDLRRPLAVRAVVVHAGIPQVLKGGTADLPGGLLHRCAAVADALQQGQQLPLVHSIPLSRQSAAELI